MDFVVPYEKVDILLTRSHYIRTLFDVQILVQQEPVNGKQWVKLCARQFAENGKEGLQKAREYIEALCCPEITKTIPMASQLIPNLDSIARNYGVVANADNNDIILRGSQINVALAKSWMEKENEEASTSDNGTSTMNTCRKFAMKLGYSETDIEVVAKTLGPGPVDINIFLQELIRRNRSRTTSAIMANTNTTTVSDRRRADIVPRGISTRSMETDSGRSVIEAPRQRYEAEQPDCRYRHDLCPIIIDGSNIAMHHGNHRVFSCRGISLCVQWFQKRGHTEVYALVPRYRAEQPRLGYPIEDQHLLVELYDKGVIKFTPSRCVDDGRDIVCYDDRFILDLAHKLDGVIVSNDGYRDLIHEKAEWKHIIEKRVLMYSFVRDLFMVPEDPLGRKGPKLNEFLSRRVNIKHTRICPWIGNCTYGSKCRYYHPDREHELGEEWQGCQQDHRQQQQQQQLLRQDHQHLLQQEYWNHHIQQDHRSEQYSNLQIQQQQQQQQAQLGQHLYQDQMTSSWTPMYSTPLQYSYTPPNSFGYNNSRNSNEQTMFARLSDIFPHDGKRIKQLLEENNGKENIEELIEKLLS